MRSLRTLERNKIKNKIKNKKNKKEKIMRVKVTLITEMLGTIPKDKEIYSTYIESKKPTDEIENEIDDVIEAEEKGWTGFHQDENGLYVMDYFIKGFLKHSANVQKEAVGIKAFRAKITDFVA